MANIDIKQALGRYGLDDKEIKVYLALLSWGNATVKELAESTKLKRTSIYLIADRLVSLGILGQYKAKYGTHYVAESPKKLISRLESIKNDVSAILPQLEALEKKEDEEASVKYFKGKEGYMAVLEDTLAGYSHEMYYLGSTKDLNDIISEKYVTDHYIPERLKRRIMFKQIVFADDFAKQQKLDDGQNLRVTKFLPQDRFFTGSMLVYQDKVAYFSSKRELSCVVIESRDIAEMERQKFLLLWEKIN